jgi:hypothetical protein
MGNVREVFPVLEDPATGAGATLAKVASGDAPGSKNGLLAFAFRDASGNLVLPQLTSTGALVVDTEAVNGTCKSARGLNTGSLTVVTLATISLTASKQISQIQASLSASRASLAEIVWIDNASETIIGWLMTGPGQFTVTFDQSNLLFTTGGTGTQSLLIRALNLEKASNLYASIACIEAN